MCVKFEVVLCKLNKFRETDYSCIVYIATELEFI